MPVRKLKSNVLRKKITSECKRSVRHKELMSWSEIRTIGILYPVPEEADYIHFCESITALQNEKKEVRTLGLIPLKEAPHYCYPKLYFEYFSKKDLNWFGKPRSSKLNDFIHADLDLLINLDLSGNEVFDYLACLSKARLKTGLFKPAHFTCYDLMISQEDLKDPAAILEFVRSWIKTLRPES